MDRTHPDSGAYHWPMPTPVVLTREQMEEIAELAAEKAVKRMERNLYAGIGAAVVRKGLYVIGVTLAIMAAWLTGKGHL